MRAFADKLTALTRTIEAISSSPEIEGYVIGITASLRRRHGEYRGEQIPNLIALAFDLTAAEAKKIEQELHVLCRERGGHCQRKYKNKDERYRKSIGGVRPNELAKCYFVYMAWW
jgi:hypothetical protein